MKTVFFDIDTQLDFVYPAGALYVPDAERIVPAVAELNRYAAAHGIPVVSTVDAHAENDDEFRTWPHHCVVGTHGQRKAESTLLDKPVVIPNREYSIAIEGARQIIVEKQTFDVFKTRNVQQLLEALGADRYVVYGVVTEICVAHAVRGLLKTRRPVVVVTDAVKTLKEQESEQALAELVASGAVLATVSETM